jgi:hypothetical protein
MSNATVLFKKLDLNYVRQELIDHEFENNGLECKEKSGADRGGLDEKDKSNFAKALSGFANTSSGVLIFGLAARKKDEIDQIIGIRPIKELRRFESALREHESRIVERLVPGVEYKAIETSPGEGMVLCRGRPDRCPLPAGAHRRCSRSPRAFVLRCAILQGRYNRVILSA